MSRKDHSQAKPHASRAALRSIQAAGGAAQIWLWGGAIVLLTLLAYTAALANSFIWDDDFYILANDTLRSFDGLRRMWFEPRSIPQYYPLVHTTFWVEFQLWSLHAAGYHLVNVLLHATTALLLWRVLVRLSVPGAWLAAALFAVHPVEVESVAWITERKNVLSAALALASLLAYLRFAPPELPAVKPRDPALPPAWGWYALSLALFVAALLSKTVTVSLPAVLLVIFWWKRGRVSLRDVALLVPFFAIGLALAVVTVVLEKAHVGARGADWNLGPIERVLVAGRALWFYAAKLAWPAHLNFFYPRWTIDPRDLWQYAYPLAAGGVLVGLWLARGRIGRGPLAAVLIFAGVLVPALGFFDVFPFRYSFVADHFQYHASMSLIALAAAGAVLAWQRLGARSQFLGTLAASAVLATLAALTWQRTHVYADQMTLFTDVVARDPQSWIGHNNLGTLYLQRKSRAKALAHLSIAARLNPQHLETYNAMATALEEEGEYRAAIAQFERALHVTGASPQLVAVTENNFASLLATCQDARYRDPPRAIELAERALKVLPQQEKCWCTLGAAQYRAGNWSAAIAACEQALALDELGENAERFIIAMAHWQLGRHEEARRWYDQGVQWRADNESDNDEARRFQDEAKALLGQP